MAIKTICLEIDAYEKLKRMKRGRESFSEVVRRAHFAPEACTGEAILSELNDLRESGAVVSEATLDYWKRSEAEDAANPRISESKWAAE
jgi:hypothetical protein